MKFNFRYSFAFFLVAMLLIGAGREYLVKEEISLSRKPASELTEIAEEKIKVADVALARRPRENNTPAYIIKNLKMKKMKRQPASVAYAPLIEEKSYQGLRGLKVAKDLRAIKTSDFSPEMGDVLKQHAGMTYFKPASGRKDDSFANVVYDKANNRYFPLSASLRVQDIGNEGRENIQQAGFQEFYYSSPSRVLYVSSAHDRLFQDYSALESQGYKVSFEVLRGENRSR